jgi:hypothetical protein
MAEKLLQVNFGLNVTPAEYKLIAASVANAFAEVPGLRWKVWILNEAQREAGGVYLFEDQRALDNFMHGDLAKVVATHPSLKNAAMKQFDVMPEVTAVTRGPVGAPLTV